MKKIIFSLLTIVLVLNFSGCVQTTMDDAAQPGEPPTTSPGDNATLLIEPPVTPLGLVLVKSEKPRVTSPDVTEKEIATLVNGNNAFAIDLYKVLRTGDENLLYSPYSVSIALAMVYAGAREETAEQMMDTLHFNLDKQRLHPTFNALDLELDRRGVENKSFQLSIANALWSQKNYEILPEFLDILAENYGTGLNTLDFINELEQSRSTINEWASRETKGKITNVIPKDAIDEYTRFVLTNAIYFKADWEDAFKEQLTSEDTFYLLNGDTVMVPMMTQTERFRYVKRDSYQVVELPYKTGPPWGASEQLSMVIILPDAGTFESFEELLDGQTLLDITDSLKTKSYMNLFMPKFKFETSFSLIESLRKMGMLLAFSKDEANFSGITGIVKSPFERLYIQKILQKAFIAVDEKGTEAAAVTAVSGARAESVEPEPIMVRIDRPFIFMIRDMKTGTVFFIGRVLNPNR